MEVISKRAAAPHIVDNLILVDDIASDSEVYPPEASSRSGYLLSSQSLALFIFYQPPLLGLGKCVCADGFVRENYKSISHGLNNEL